MKTMNRLFPAVSNLGRFRKAGSDKPQVVGPSGRVEINGDKYFLDRLVCRAFHGPPSPWTWKIVEHLDGDSNNNRMENLAWTKREIWRDVTWLSSEAEAENEDEDEKNIFFKNVKT